MKIIGIIPARYKSSRFEGKALADILGKPMVQHVYERAVKAKTLDDVIVATDDQRIFDCVQNFGGKVVMTSVDCPTGTNRIAEERRVLATAEPLGSVDVFPHQFKAEARSQIYLRVVPVLVELDSRMAQL